MCYIRSIDGGNQFCVRFGLLYYFKECKTLVKVGFVDAVNCGLLYGNLDTCDIAKLREYRRAAVHLWVTK